MTEEEKMMPNCPKCNIPLIRRFPKNQPIPPHEYDYECPKCHSKFELLKMNVTSDKFGNVKRHYKLRAETKITS